MAEDQLGSLPPPSGHSQSKRSSRASARHVSFSETSAPSNTADQTILLPPDLDGERPKRFRPRAYYACCAWGCLFVFAFVLLALVVGLVFISIFHSYLPEVRVRSFNATRIDFATHKQQEASVKGKVDLLVEFWNKNEKTELKFGDLKLSASAAHVDLGRTEFRSFTQAHKSTKSLNATIGVNRVGVDKDDAEQLSLDIKNHEVNLKLSLVGSISFPIGGVMMNQIPIIAACDCKQKEVDFGNNAKCNYRIFKS